ncbi:MAG TPA: glutamine synthetase type III, partial [Elusimicrobiota bacterium]|nr:glutamine synthetase type III [Elusimicrobiota bacterium]
RTSPFAFTGNKFEFRMVPSSASIAGANTILNTIAAEALDEIADRLEKSKDIEKEVNAIVREAVQKHGRVIFNGNGYSEDWVKEAAKRGLPNIKSSIEAFAAMATDSAVKLFEKYKVLSGRELHSRYEIYVEQYAKHINIEARCAIQMVKNQYLPAVIAYTGELAQTVNALKTAGADTKVQAALLKDVNELLASATDKLGALEEATAMANNIDNVVKKAEAFRDNVFTAQADLRKDIDALETLLPADLWPVPTYAEMLFNL